MMSLARFRYGTLGALSAALVLWGCGQQDEASGKAENASAAQTGNGTTNNNAGAAETDAPTPADASGVKAASSHAASNAISSAPASHRSRELTDPDHDAMGWIYLDWSGVDPKIAATAQRNVPGPGSSFDGMTVNEFNRSDLVAKEEARLQSLFDANKGVGFITFNISGNLSDYDPNYGEFYISAFSPGGAVSFGTFGQNRYSGGTGLTSFTVGLKLNNALDAYVWKVTPDEAAKVIAAFEREGARTYRRVYARTKLKILDAEASTAPTRNMNTQILSFTLFTDKGTRLGHFDLSQ